MLPRQVLPRQFYLITRRCTQRQFLLRPDAPTNNAFLYCLGRRPFRGSFHVRVSDAVAGQWTLSLLTARNVVLTQWQVICWAPGHASAPGAPTSVLPDHSPLHAAPVLAAPRRAHQQRVPLLPGSPTLPRFVSCPGFGRGGRPMDTFASNCKKCRPDSVAGNLLGPGACFRARCSHVSST